MKESWPASIQPQLKDFPENSVAVVVCLRDNLKFFKLAFHSIMSFTSHPYLFVVVDNLSSFTTKNYLKRLQKNHPICVMPFNQEFNFAAQLNFGFNYSFTFPQIKYGAMLHSDAVVEPNWLSRTLHRLSDGEKNGTVGTPHGEHYLVFRRDVFAELRGFDDKFKGHTYVVKDFCNRAKTAGWRHVDDNDANIHHYFQTQLREGLVTTNHIVEDRKLYFQKHPELGTPNLEPQGDKK